jgi:hypothetical protein
VGYIFGADEWNDGRILAPGQEDSALLSDAPADKSAHVFVVGRRLEMNSAYLRPVEDAIGQPMLQIAEAGSVLQIAKSRIVRRTLKLRIVHHQFQAGIACGCCEDCDRLKQPIGHRVGEVRTLDIPQGSLD